MIEFRIMFTQHRGVNVEAETEEEARQIVIDNEFEYGMDWETEKTEIDKVEEI